MWLVEGEKLSMDGDGDRCQMEVVKKDGQVVVKAFRRREIEQEGASRNARWDMLFCILRLVVEPQLQEEHELRVLQSFFYLKM